MEEKRRTAKEPDGLFSIPAVNAQPARFSIGTEENCEDALCGAGRCMSAGGTSAGSPADGAVGRNEASEFFGTEGGRNGGEYHSLVSHSEKTSVLDSMNRAYAEIPVLASGKSSFLLYIDQLLPLVHYSDADVGKLFKALIDEMCCGAHAELPGTLTYPLEMIAMQVFRDRRRYLEKCEKNRRNAQKRWGKKADGEEQTSSGSDSSREIENIYSEIPVKPRFGEGILPERKPFYPEDAAVGSDAPGLSAAAIASASAAGFPDSDLKIRGLYDTGSAVNAGKSGGSDVGADRSRENPAEGCGGSAPASGAAEETKAGQKAESGADLPTSDRGNMTLIQSENQWKNDAPDADKQTSKVAEMHGKPEKMTANSAENAVVSGKKGADFLACGAYADPAASVSQRTETTQANVGGAQTPACKTMRASGGGTDGHPEQTAGEKKAADQAELTARMRAILKKQAEREEKERRKAALRVFPLEPGAQTCGIPGGLDPRCAEKRAEMARVIAQTELLSRNGTTAEKAHARAALLAKLDALTAVSADCAGKGRDTAAAVRDRVH